MLNDIIQTVPEAKKLLDSVGVDTKDLEPTVKDAKTGAVIGQKTERQAQIRVEDTEEAIASNERLNQLIKERTALLQQEANAARQVNAVTSASTTATSDAPSRRSRGSRSSSTKQAELPGEYGIVPPVTRGTNTSPKRLDVLRNDADVASLTKSELSQLRSTVQAVAKKLTEAGSDRGAGLLQSIKPGSSPAEIVNAFEEAMTSVVMDSGKGYQPVGQAVTSRMTSTQSFRQGLQAARQMVRQAITRPVVQRRDLSRYDSAYGTGIEAVVGSTSDADGEGFGDYLTAGAEQRASGKSRRRSLHNTFGKVKDAIKHRLGIRLGKGNQADLDVQQETNRGNMEGASAGQLLSEGVDYEITQSMNSIVQNAIEDLRAGRVASPTSNPAAAGTSLSSSLPRSIVSALVRFAPLVQGASRETTARGAIGREGKSFGVFGGPTAQDAFSAIFSTFLAEKLQANSGMSREAQIQMLQGLNISQIFEDMFAPSGIGRRKEGTTSLAGILHQRVKDDLEKKVKRAEETYATAVSPEDKKAAKYALESAQAEHRAYLALDQEPISVTVPASSDRRATDATMPMRYGMSQDQLREDLKPKYATGTTTAQLVQDGVRTATTRSGGGYKPGQVIEIPEAPGRRYEVTSVEKPDFSTPEGIAAWEKKEGWSFKDLPEHIRKQVTSSGARQITFRPYDEETGSTTPSTYTIPTNIPVPADMIANPSARVTGVENSPEEMIQRVGGGIFDRSFTFSDMVTTIRPIANRALSYLSRLGRADLPVPFDSPTPLQIIAQNNQEGLPLDQEIQSSLDLNEELKERKNKFSDNILAGFGLISSNSRYQNFSKGLQVASEITDEDKKVDSKKARKLDNPLGQIKNFFSSMQQLEQMQESGFPIVAYAEALDPDNLNEDLASEMESVSPLLQLLREKKQTAKIRKLSRSKKFKEADSFQQFRMLAEIIRPVLEPALAEGGNQAVSIDTLMGAPEILRQNLPLLHTPGDMSDRLAQVMGTTEDLQKARAATVPASPISLAKSLRFRISTLARSILGRMPSPAYNDAVVQRHKREGIVDTPPNEDLKITDALAAKQTQKELFTKEEKLPEFTYHATSYGAGEHVNLEDEKEKLDRILRTSDEDLTPSQLAIKADAEMKIEAGRDPLEHLVSKSRQDNAVNYDPAANAHFSSKGEKEDTGRSELDNLIAKFQKYQGDNKGLKQLLATAIGSPESRQEALKYLGDVTPAMSNTMRYLDFGDATEVEKFLKTNAASKNPAERALAPLIAEFMRKQKGHKFLENPAIAKMFNTAAEDMPSEDVIDERRTAKEEIDRPLALRLGPLVGKLRVLQKLKNFGRESINHPSLRDPKFLADMQSIFEVLAPEETEQFRKMDPNNPEHVQSLTTTETGKQLIARMRNIARGLYIRHMRHPQAESIEPNKIISDMRKTLPDEDSTIYAGSIADNAKLLARDTTLAEAEDVIDEDPRELFAARLEEEDRRAAIAQREKENADREREVNEALDRREFKEAASGKRRLYFGSNSKENQERRSRLFKRLTRNLRPLGWWEARPVKRTKKVFESLFKSSREYLESKQRERDAKKQKKEIDESMPAPDVPYGLNLSRARGIPEFIKEFKDFNVDEAIRAQYGNPERSEYISEYGSRFNGEGIDPSSKAYAEMEKEMFPEETRAEKARRLWNIRQDRRHEKAKKDAMAQAEAEGITDPNQRAMMANMLIKRTQFRSLDSISHRRNTAIIIAATKAELDKQVNGSRFLPAPDPSRPEEEYTKTHSQIEAEKRQADEAERQRKRARRRPIASRVYSVWREYTQGKGARPRRTFLLPDVLGPEIAARLAQEKAEEDRINGRRMLPAPDPSRPEEEYTKTHSQLEAERLQAEEAERQRSRNRYRRVASRAYDVWREYTQGRGARPRRQFNLGGPTPDTDPFLRPLVAQRDNRPESAFSRFRQSTSAFYRRLTNGGIDVGQMPLFPRIQRERPASIAEEREARRQQREETNEEIQRRIIEDRAASVANGRFLLPAPDPNRPEEEYTRTASQIRQDGINAKARATKRRNARRRRAEAVFTKYKSGTAETSGKVFELPDRQAEAQRREDEAESQIRLIREVTDRVEFAPIREEEYEGRLRYIRRLNFSERTRSKHGASYQAPKYERQTPEIDNPEYIAAVEKAKEKVNNTAGLTESQKDAYLQRLISKITVPKQTPTPVSKFSKFKDSTSKFLKELIGRDADEGSGTSRWQLFPDIGTGKNVLLRQTPRIKRKKAEAAGKMGRRPEIDAKIALKEAEQKAAKEAKPVKMVETDNPEYLAAVAEAKERVEKIAGRISPERKEAYLQNLLDRIAVPAKLTVPATEAISARERQIIDKHVEKYAAARVPRKQRQSVESKKRRPETDLAVAERERKAKEKGEALATVEIDNPAYLAEVEKAKERLAKIAGRVDDATYDAYLQKLVSKITVPAKIMGRRQKPVSAAEQKRIEDYDAQLAASRESRRKEKSIESKRRQPETEARVADRERRQYYKAHPEAMFFDTSRAVMENPALVARRKEIDRLLDERATRTGKPVSDAMRKRAYSMLSREENPEYAKAVKSVTDWMDSKSITDPEERAMLLARVNVPQRRSIPQTVQTPKGYRIDRQPKDYINLAELRNYSPESDPGAGMRMATDIVETAIQKKLFSDMGPMTAEEMASRQARAQKIRDRLLKNKRPYNVEWQKAQRRDEIEELLTYPEEILSDSQRAQKADLLARFEKGEDIYALDSGKGSKKSGSGSGGSGKGGGGGGSPPSDDEDSGEEGGRRRGGRKTGRRREGSGTTVTATGSPVNITANTVTATGSPVNIVAAGLAVSGSGSATGAHAAPASGASGTALHAAVVAAASAPPTTPASIVAGRTLVGIGPFGPIYKTGSATTGTAAAAPAAGAGAGFFSMFPGLAISGGGGFGGGGGGGLPFGVGGEFGEGGARNFGADRLLAVQQLRAARNAYEQNMGSLGGAGVGISRRELTGIAQSTTKSIIDNNDNFKDLLATADKGGYGQEANDLQAIFTSLDEPGKNLADLATDLSRLQNALMALDKAAEATQNDAAATAEEVEQAAKVRAAAAKTGALAGFAIEEQDRAAKDVEKETNRRLSALREGLQANTTQQSLFGYTIGQDVTRRGLLKNYANEITGGQGNLLYNSFSGKMQAYGVNWLGKEVRRDLRTASAADIEYTQKKLAGGDSEYQRRVNATNAALDKKGITDVARRQKILDRVTREADKGPGVDVTTTDLTSLQKTLNEEKSARNQSTLASRFSHFTQKAQQINYWATAAFNAPTAIMDAIDQAVRPALNAEKTMISARTLALSPETYGNAMQAALTQQQLFGGTLTKNIGQVTGFIPLANSYGVDINKTFNVARKLAAFDPAQGTEGAQIAIREFLSGNMSSLSRRFEISRSALSNIKQGDATEMLDSLDALLSGMGLTDRLIEDQAASMATKYDKMLGRLEAAQLSFSKIAVSALEPVLNYFVGDDSYMAATTKRDTTDTVLKERVAKRGDSVLTQAAQGRKVIKDLNVDSEDFIKDLDLMLANANEAMVKENKLIEDSTGVNVNATLYKRLNQMTPEEQATFKADIKTKMITGMTQESAIRQTIAEQTDYAGYQQFVTSRLALGSLNTTPEMLQNQLQTANKALISKDNQELVVKNLEVLDGDTFKMNLDSGLEVSGRFLGVDAPEKSSAEGLALKKELQTLIADPNKEVRVFGGYGADERYGRPLVRALVRDKITGEEYDLAAKLLAEGKVEYNDFGNYNDQSAEGRAALDNYRTIGQSAADQGIGAVNQFAASMGYGATLQPTQAAIDAVFTKKYGLNGSNLGGLLPAILVGAGTGAAIGTFGGPLGIGAGAILGGIAGGMYGTSLNRAAFDEDTSVEQRQEILKETEKQMRKDEIKNNYANQVRREIVTQKAEKYNNELMANNPALAKNPENLINNQDIEDMIAGKFDRPQILRFTGQFGSLLEEEVVAAQEEFATSYYNLQETYKDQLATTASSLTETQQTALSMLVPSLDDPSKMVSITERTAQAFARQAVAKSADGEGPAAAGVFYGPETAKTVNESITTFNIIADKRTIEAVDTLAKKGELVEVPTGKTLLKTVPVVNPETGVQEFDPLTLRPKVKVESVPQTELRPATHAEVLRAFKENDTAFLSAVVQKANLPENQNRSTYYEEAKKYSDALLDESTKLRESLFVGLTSNAALVSFTGVGQTAAEKYTPPDMPETVDTGTTGQAESSSQQYSLEDKALAFTSGFEIDASKSENDTAINALKTATKQNIDKIKSSAQAFEQLAASTYAFDVQFKSTFRNFADAVVAAGDNARTIMMNMGQGNPRFALDHVGQLTGIDFKQLALQYQILPGMQTRPSTNGQTTTYGYTQGPAGTLKFVKDFMQNPDFMSQFKESELLQVFNMATGASTQLAQRGMQQNWQMQDMAKNNARSIEDINRNGMNSLISIHRGYVQQMLVMASQAEVNKRMSEATTQEAINIAEIPEEQRREIDAKDKLERSQVEHLAQFNIAGYLETKTGKADTEMQDLFKELQTKGPENSPEYEEFWKTRIIPARNARKDAALARSKDQSLSPEERRDAENEYIELNDNPDRALKGYQWVDERTRERLRRAAGIRQQEKNLEGLRLQRSGLLLTQQKLNEDMQKANGDPIAQANIGQSIAENERAIRENGDAMDAATRTINALRDTQDKWFEGSNEQWKQLLIGVESASAGAKRSIEDLAISMKTQYEEAYIKFEQARTDMVTSFSRAATEIAAQVPLSIAPGLDAIMALSTASSAANIAYNNGVEVEDANGKMIAGPDAAFTIMMDGAIAAAKRLYPDTGDDRYKKFMEAVAESARTRFTAKPADPNNPSGSLPSGLDLFKGSFNGKDGLRVIVLNDGKITVTPTTTSASGVVIP